MLAYEQIALAARRAVLPARQAEAALGRAQALEALGRAEARARPTPRQTLSSTPAACGSPSVTGKRASSPATSRAPAPGWIRAPRGERRKPGRLLELLHEAATAARRSRARILAALQRVERLDALLPAEHEAWQKDINTYRAERAALDEDRAGRGESREQDAQRHRLDTALDRALSRLGPTGADTAAASLPDPAKGEVILVYHPVRDGWVGLALNGDGVVAHRLGSIDVAAAKDALSAQLLQPFSPQIEGAQRVRFAPYGPLAQVDFHALPWKGGHPLIESVPVVYGVDLPRSESDLAPSPAGKLALVVSDPTSTLPSARREASDMASKLAQMSYQVTRLAQDAATYEEVRDALEPSVELFALQRSWPLRGARRRPLQRPRSRRGPLAHRG